jgi:transcriptional regulator with XRE-family HTH domain
LKQIKNEYIYKRIKEERQRLGLNQAQLAKKAKITPAAVSQIEKGLRTPSIPVLQKIAQVLEVSMDYLSGNTMRPELNDLLQNKEVREFYRGFQALENEDKKTILKNIEFLQDKYKKEK